MSIFYVSSEIGNPWSFPEILGSSVNLAKPHARFDQPPMESFPHSSTGISSSAFDIEQYLLQMLREMDRWKRDQLWDSEDIEQDIAVLLPPKAQRIVKVRARLLGQAAPLINLDEVYID